MSFTDYQLELLTFPCTYPIKAFAAVEHDVQAILCEILNDHNGQYVQADITIRESTAGRYRAVTITFEATSKTQLDAIYAALREDERIKMSL